MTRESLMRGLHDGSHSPEVAREIVDRYFAVIYQLARQIRIPIEDLDETVQDTAKNLIRSLPQFRYDRRKGRFRNYLKRCIYTAFLAIVRRRERDQEQNGMDLQLLQELARDQNGEAQVESTMRLSELQYAVQRAQSHFNDTHQAVVNLRLLAGEPSAVVAERLQLTVANVDQIVKRFRAKLQEILHKMDQNSDEFWGGPQT